MSVHDRAPRSGTAWGRGDLRGILSTVLAVLMVACTTPGAVAPSTMPVTGRYVELGTAEESSSCGYTFLFLPLGAPKPVSALIEDLVRSRGGDALIEVSSGSSSTFYLVGMSHCLHVRGKVVKFTK